MLPDWFGEIRGQVPRAWRLVLGAIPVTLLLALWWFYTAGESNEDRRISGLIMPNPAEVLQSFRDLWAYHDDRDRGLGTHIWLSFSRVGLGFLLAVAVVFPLGVAMAAFGSGRALFAPLATASSYIPIATLVPLTMSIWGTQEKQRVYFLALAFGIYLLPLFVKAIDAVPDVFLRTAWTLGATRWQVVSRVLVPVALPDLWGAMRLAFGVGWTYLVIVEVVVKEGGLGDLIDTARRRAVPGRVWVAILIITLIAWSVDLVWDRVGGLLFHYNRSRT